MYERLVYIKQGTFQDMHEGPFADDALLQLAFDGKIKPTTLISHATQTRGNWVEAKRVAALNARFAAGKAHSAHTYFRRSSWQITGVCGL